MQIQKAREILQALVNGVDPTTGHELPSGTVLERADVVRALVLGVNAVKELVARASRRQQLPRNIGKSWSEEEVNQLVEERRAGKPVAEIASSHGRTVRAIESRLEILGLIDAEERTTADRFDWNASADTAKGEGKPTRRAKFSRKSHE